MMPGEDPSWADLFRIGTKSIVDNARRLGLTWGLRMGTVTEVVSANRLLIRFDGDEENASVVSVVSVIGSRAVGTRVYVITIPPAGNFVIGQVDAFTPEPTPTRIATSFETGDSAGFTVETVIATITADLVAGRTYKVHCNTQIGSTVVNDVALIRLREDNVTGTLIGLNTGDIHTTGNIATVCPVEVEYTPATDETKTFVVSAARLTGTGNIRREATPYPGWPQLFYIDYVSG